MLLCVASSGAVDGIANSAAARLIPHPWSNPHGHAPSLRGSLEEATAALYEGEACRKAITKANRSAWEDTSCCWVSHAKKMQLGDASPWSRALYVRNQKAASASW